MEKKFLYYVDRQQIMTPEKWNKLSQRLKDHTKEDIEDLEDHVRFMIMTEEQAMNYKEEGIELELYKLVELPSE